MSRPKPEILFHKDIDDEHFIEILSAEAVYVVVYKLKPINIKTSNWLSLDQRHVYKKVAYPNSAPARILADKLNLEFNTKDFTVKRIV